MTEKIAIYGAGAMGTVLGALLSRGADGAKIDLISRNRAHIEAMKKNGARIVCSAVDKEFTVKVNALFPQEMHEKYDVIFLMTKQKENGKIAAFLAEFLKTDGIICTVQNGLPEESVAEAIGAEKTYGAVAAWGATFLGEGAAELTSVPEAMRMEIGCFSGKGDKLEKLKEILAQAGNAIENPEFVKTTDNLLGSRWSKLAVNAAFSGLSVLTGMTFGEIAEKRKTRKIALGIFRECFAVADAAGVSLEKMQGHDMKKLLGGKGGFAAQRGMFLLPIAMKSHRNLLSGMLKDIQNGKKCEIDYINGVVRRWGDRYNVDTPLCDLAVEIAHGIENGLYEISIHNIDFFENTL